MQDGCEHIACAASCTAVQLGLHIRATYGGRVHACWQRRHGSGLGAAAAAATQPSMVLRYPVEYSPGFSLSQT